MSAACLLACCCNWCFTTGNIGWNLCKTPQNLQSFVD
jgi:hypothetical protein